MPLLSNTTTTTLFFFIFPMTTTSIDPGPVRLERDSHGRLFLLRDGRRHPVRARACFPWTDPGRFISLRDHDDHELALVEDPQALDPDSREALGSCANESRFVFEITRITRVDKEHELRAWQVETAQGARRFQTKLDDWPRPLESGGWLLRDVAGDLFFVRDLQRLDKASREILSGFID